MPEQQTDGIFTSPWSRVSFDENEKMQYDPYGDFMVRIIFTVNEDGGGMCKPVLISAKEYAKGRGDKLTSEHIELFKLDLSKSAETNISK